ncbi:hypothetical protein [Adlercreutzia sp. ZJ141]|uniref:hypothetical protein n=1 Tax=Adlercreutzia sp. ZJ141 TaxID=2709406 RepID=UPI0013EC94D8|nr:hypothetical protein [Adlercreutzia sp. ZJ141]
MGCLAFSAVVFAVFFMADGGIDTDDDWTIAMVLGGNYGSGGNCLFLNSALACFIYQCGLALPGVNWFTVFELMGSVLSLAIVLYLSIREAGLGFSFLLAFLLVRYVLPFCTFRSNYTVVTALVAGAGFFLLLCWAKDKLAGCAEGQAWRVPVGLTLAVFGMCWRPLSFLLSLPFVALAFAAVLVVDVLRRRESLSKPRIRTKVPVASVCATGIALAVVCGGLVVFDAYMWSQPGWSDWKQYHDARSELSDFPTKEYEEIRGELSAVGVSENDYRLVTSWATNDPEFFTVEKMRQIAEVAADESPVPLDEYASKLASCAREYAHHYAVWLLICGVAFLRVLMSGAESNVRRAVAVFLILNVIGVLLISAYFVYVGRFPLRVCLSILVPSSLVSAFMVGCAGGGSVVQLRPACRVLFAGLGTAGCLALCLSICSVATAAAPSLWGVLRNPGPVSSEEPLYELVSTGDNVFVWDVGEYYVIQDGVYGCRSLPSRDFMQSNLTLGGWTTHAPFRMDLEARSGMGNPFRGLLENPRARYVARDLGRADQICQYLREHYSPTASYEVVEQVESFGDTYSILRFSEV